MDYIELKLEIHPADPWIDLISSDLGGVDFESFETEGNILKAYISEDDFDQSRVDAVIREYSSLCDLSPEFQKIKSVNWNEEWEKNFKPIDVAGKVIVRSSFHKIDKNYEYEVLIDPKMSFGTGHHATTYLMIEKILDLNLKDLDVLDMGCGTAVLAILAKKKNAKNVLAIDIDEWAFENANENITINNQNIVIEKGGSDLIANRKFDVILANINLNVLLGDLNIYKNALNYNGQIIFSGVLEKDKYKLKDKCIANGLDFVEERKKDNWMLFHFSKSN